MKKDPKNPVAASQLKAPELTDKASMPKEQKGFDVKQYLGLSAQVAQDTTYIRNTRYPNAAKHFPVDPIMRTVDKYFRDAVGGPLYLDEPQTELDIARCKKKAEVMRIERLRYAYIAPDMELEDVLAQLEEGSRGVA